MNWIVPVLKIALVLTLDPIQGYDDPVDGFHYLTLPEQIVSVETTVGVQLFGFIGIEGDAFVYTVPPWTDGSQYFAPFQSDFYFRAYLFLDDVKIGWEHLCTHPTDTYGQYRARRYGGKDSFYITYELGGGH